MGEIAWVGGFFSGEGTINTHWKDGRAYAQMSIGNTDLEALQRCQAVIGGTIYGPYLQRSNLQRTQSWTLKTGNLAYIKVAARMLTPWLSPSKAAQAQQTLLTVAANPPPVPHRDRWRTRQERHGPTGGNRPRAVEPVPCGHGHPASDRYEYRTPGGRTYWKCRGCQRDHDKGRER